MTDDCIFCRIIRGEIPAYTLYEDEHFIAMLDHFPLTPGHVLLIPKAHIPDLFGLPDGTAQALIPLAQRIAANMRDVLHFDGCNLRQNNGKAAGQEVPHFHLHLIPRFTGDYEVKQGERRDPSPEALAEMLEKLRMD